jgi:hypothetical protein
MSSGTAAPGQSRRAEHSPGTAAQPQRPDLPAGRSGGGAFLARPEYAEIAPRNIFPTPFNPVDRVFAQRP